MAGWTFITNHGAVLALLRSNLQMTTRQVAATLGVTERTVLRIVKDLETEGYIQRERAGRANRYVVNTQAPLRRPEQRDVAVGDLLAALAPGDQA